MEGGYPAEPAESENQNGTVGANAAYTAKTYEGFTYQPTLTKVNNTVQTDGTINADSSTVVELYYERNTVNVIFKLAGGNVSSNTADIIKTGKYGTTLTAPAPEREGYAFKGWSPEPPSPLAFPAINTEYTAQWKINKYPVIFNVDGAGGTLKATVGETEINSGDKVEHGKTVTFTATSATGYRVKGWMLDGTAIAESGTNTEYTLTVTKPAAVTVNFELGKALLTLDPSKLTIKVKAKTKDDSVIEVEGCNETELASDAETELHANGTTITLQGYITELNCSGTSSDRPLTALDVSGLTALQKLDCKDNQLTELNVQGLTALQELDCGFTQLTALNVQGLTALQKLDCTNNQLTELNVQSLTALQELNCRYNQLTALSVQGLTALQSLNCTNDHLTELNVQGLLALQKLDCGGNHFTALNVQGLTALQSLDCTNDHLTELNVQGLLALQKLDCKDNQLASLDVSGLTVLQELYCNNNQLTELNVSGCTALQHIECYYNRLKAEVFTKLFTDLPTRTASDGAQAILYVEQTVYEKNCTNFTTPESLKDAFDNAKDVKHWKMQKTDGFVEEDI
ncbi:leucine-rich repeat domain-containing protein [Treponema vincentii]